MKDRELDKKFENVDLPQVKLPEAKARLRRELLTAPHFERRAARIRGFLRVRYALTALAAVAVAGFIVIQLMPDRLSARALIDNMEAAYDSRVVANAVHYFRQTLTLPRGRHFEVEQWVHPDEDKIRVRLKDGDTGDVIAHSIMVGQRTYGLDSASGRTRARIRRVEAANHGTAHEGGMMTVVLMRLHEDDEWADETVVQVIVMDDGFDRDQFMKKTPRAIISDLAGSSDITYSGATFEPRLNQKIEILERRNAATLPFKLEFKMKHLDKVQWFLTSIISNEISLEMDTEFLEQNNLGGDIKIRPIESVETIEVIAESSRIHRMTLTVFEDGVETYRAEKTFLEDRYLSYAPDMFDPGHHGLTQIPNTDERSIK